MVRYVMSLFWVSWDAAVEVTGGKSRQTLRGPSDILLGINTLWAAESFSNRQRPDEKQDRCPPGGEGSRVKDRRFITQWDVTEIHYTPQPQLH